MIEIVDGVLRTCEDFSEGYNDVAWEDWIFFTLDKDIEDSSHSTSINICKVWV